MFIQRKKLIRCGLSIVLMLSLFTTGLFAQDSLAIQRFDERSLSVWTGTTVVADPTAHGGRPCLGLLLLLMELFGLDLINIFRQVII
ncbi:hypothetical protein B0O44_104376 [Pedobacter nutrimenti]|uniref:Uncharacterized protein n=1 Tax=Pedobacter nutrimenti TaxID=1241337 RepID=A0A318UJS1_9SPHI|nr:hypothetical protein B0O44_104376 [Pedobacter nutrimenti]